MPELSRAGLGCVVLFLTPFAAAGAFAGWQAIREALRGDWVQAGLLAVFALVFGGVGFGGFAAAAAGRRRMAAVAALRARHPAEPWRWRPEWDAGRLEDQSRGTMWGAWAFAAFWNLVSLPGAVAALRAASREGKPAAYLALLFPLVGLGLLAWAVRATIRYRKFGVSRLELATRPGVVGRSLGGTVRAPADLRPEDGFRLTLSAVRRVTSGAGRSRSTHETILWQEERRERGQPSRDARGMSTAVPVAFRIPSDAAPFDDTTPGDAVIWRLKVEAEAPGVDYAATFEVPVFRTAESAQPLPAEGEWAAPAAAAAAVAADYRQPPESRIAVRTTAQGLEVFFPRARNPGAALALTAFLALWGLAIWATIHFGAPLIFPIVFGLFGVLLALGVLQLWLGITRVRADAAGVRVANGYLALGRERLTPASEIADVNTTIGMQGGGVPYYDVVIVRKNGRKVIAGRSVRDKREAEWLAITIKRAAGLA